MADKNIKNFLPSVFRTNKIKNFMDSTSETLFSDNNSENKSYFVGRRVGGLYNPLSDYYAQEINKIRENYQLEPSLVIRDKDTSEVNDLLFYEDLLRSLQNSGSQVDDHSRLFASTQFSYAPPIDMDMFINYSDYYWYPEGGFEIRVDANPSDLRGRIAATVRIIETSEPLDVSTGMHLHLNDDKVYIIEGVGTYIQLIEFDPDNNKPFKIDRVYNTTQTSNDVIERFPAEYITMERGANDKNPWSRNNSWYHKDVINKIVGQSRFLAERSRRAQRPIICFRRDIELFNYGKHVDFIKSIDTTLSNNMDGAVINNGDKVVINNDPNIYQYDGSAFVSVYTANHDDKVTVYDGNNKADEFKWDSIDNDWVFCQRKLETNQPILFNIYDSNDENATLISDEFKYPNSTFDGCEIFRYGRSSASVDDPVLGFGIKYKAFRESSDIVFENAMADVCTYEVAGETKEIRNGFYKVNNPNNVERNNIIKFTIGKDYNTGNPVVYINGEQQRNIVLKANTQYRLDYTDSSTTVRGWYENYSPIEILDENGNQVIRPTHADSSKNDVLYTFNETTAGGYVYKTPYYEGRIFVVNETVEDFYYQNSWIESKDTQITLKLEKLVTEEEDLTVKLSYTPRNDNAIRVTYNGDVLSKSSYYFSVDSVYITDIDGEVEKGDYIEVFYTTNDPVTNQTDEIQMVHPSLNNNPYNDDIKDFAFSEVFDQFRSIIRNQPFLKGTALTDNNYRDTIQDGSLGTSILKHSAPMLPLMFANLSDEADVVESIVSAKDYYNNFKNSLIVASDEFNRNNDITNENVRDIFDDIVGSINSGRRKTDPYAYSYMFATYNKYTNVTFDSNGVASEYVDIDVDSNELYIYTNDGLRLIDIDYRIDNDASTLTTTLVPLTFSVSDIVESRYYQEMEPSFCAPTPMKFGLDRPKRPEIIKDETYLSDKYFIIGHDGSKFLAYSSEDQINSGKLDGRDLIVLELEKRIYNGIRPEFKDESKRIINLNDVTPSYYKELSATKDFIENVEFKFFSKWCNDNNINYTANDTFDINNELTYNIPSFETDKGVRVGGHWKSIFQYFYGTVTPNKTPWEMLEFKIKPSWWDAEYGTDYSSNNVSMWEDIEQGIVRQGVRENLAFDAYRSSTNRLRKDGLMQILPVDANGELRTVGDIGLVNTASLNYYQIKREWSFGEFGPVEQAWRNSSDYSFVKQALYYIVKPLQYITQAWDTELSFNLPVGTVHKPSEMGVHSFVENSTNFNYVAGVSQWLYSYLQVKNLSGERLLRDRFYESDIQLSHKAGGFIDSTNINISTETFNPRSDSTVTNIPSEDISVLLHESKDLTTETYSGVLVERVDADKTFYNFNEGQIYDTNEVVYNTNDKNYYKLVSDHRAYPDWQEFTLYASGRVVKYANRLYVCLEDHRSTDQEFPNNSSKWKLRGFVSSDWALLTGKPSAKTTYFKVYGYDLYDSGFRTIPATDTSRDIEITVPTVDSKQVPVVTWEPNKQFYTGQYVRINDGNLFVCRRDHVSSETFDTQNWSRSEKLPFTNMANVSVKTEGGDKVTFVPYGTVFKTTKEVSEFLMAYGRYLESRGWKFDSFDKNRNKFKNWKLSVEEFIRWAYENKSVGSVIGLSPISEDIKFSSKHGVPSITRNKINTPVTLIGPKGNIIDPKNAEYNRSGGVYHVMAGEPVFYCKLSIKEYEHVITVNNRTVFNDVIYDPELGIRKDRLKIRTLKTKGWDGRLRAEGFIVTGDKILPNFETSVSDIKSISNKDSISIQDVYNRLKYHNFGYEQRSYLEGLSMDAKAQISFYEGFVRQKGTSEAFQRLLRSSELDVSDNMKINEEWAFKQGTFGSVETDQRVEIMFDNTDMKSTPQAVYLEYKEQFDNKKATDVYVDINDRDKWITKPKSLVDGNIFVETKFDNVKKYPTAGYVRWSDADFKAFTLKGLGQSIRESNRTITEGMRAWIAKDSSEQYGWNIYHSSFINVNVDEVITLGKDSVSSAVLRLSGDVNENYVYGIYSGGYNYTFKLTRIDPNDDVFIMLSFDEELYTVFKSTEDLNSLNQLQFVRWVPSRINMFYHQFFDDVQDTIDTFIGNVSHAPNDGFRLYIDVTNSPVSYKAEVMKNNPSEYWSFDNNISPYSGVNGIAITSEGSANVPNSVLDNYNSLSSDTTVFEPSSDEWPNMIWANMGSSNENETTMEFWFEYNDMVRFTEDMTFSYPIASIVQRDTTSGEVVSTHLGIYPQVDAEYQDYRIIHTIDGDLEYSSSIPIERGMNHCVIVVEKGTTGNRIKTIINGTVVDDVDSISGLSQNSTYEWYVSCIDNHNVSKDLPMVDELSIYESELTLIDIQSHYRSGINGLIATNEGKWGVFEYNSGSWNMIYEEQPVIDTDMIQECLIYNTEDNAYISNVKIHDPVKGYFAGAPIQDIDFITEYDPVTYNSGTENYSAWGQNKVGTVWWDTSTMRYLEYENGSSEDRINFWGTLFPQSTIDVYEWRQSSTVPSEYTGSGTPYTTSEYVFEDVYDEETNETTRYYYFWVKNTTGIPENTNRTSSIVNIANSIRYPDNNGVPYVNFINNQCLLLNDNTNVMVQNDFVLQIEYETNKDDIDTHTQWTLVSEDEREDEIPEFLFSKMIDSILGYTSEDVNGVVHAIPDTNLSETKRYGNLQYPRQTWFINTKEARRNFFEAINEALNGINIWDVELFWEEINEDVLRDTKYFGLIDWYKDGYDPLTIVSNLVNERVEILTTPLSDGEYIKVNESVGRMPSVYESGFTIYQYHEDINSYEKVGQSRAELKFKEAFYQDDITEDDAAKIRDILGIVFDTFLAKLRPQFINKIFYTMVRYVISEQPTNDWVFPTTYININQESRSLIKKRVYQDDKEEEIIGYVTEAKPFHTKLREINKIATGDIEYNGFYVTDFDKPPYLTDSREIINLQEETIDTIPYKKDLYYNLSIRNAKPVEYWPMNVKYSPSTIEGEFGVNFYNRDSDFIAKPSGICFNNGFELLGPYSTDPITLESSKITMEAWLYGHDIDILNGQSSFDVMNINVTNSDDVSDSVVYKVVMLDNNGSVEYRVQAFRGNVPYLDEVITLTPNVMNYFVFGIDNSSTNTKLNLSINRDNYLTYNLGNFINVNGFYDVSLDIGSNDVHYFYDEFALYDRPLDIQTVEDHYDYASESVPQRVFKLENYHDPASTNVFIEGVLLPKNEYSIINNELRLVNEPPRAYRHVSNVVVKSTNIADDRILSEYDQARGYYGVNKNDINEWMMTVNQKRTHAMFDRISVLPTLPLEDLVTRYNDVLNSETPMNEFSNQSYKFKGFNGRKFTETDRIITNMYFDDLTELVDSSMVEVVNAPIKKNFNIGTQYTEDNISVFVNDDLVEPRYYTTSVDSGTSEITVSMLFDVKKNSKFAVRPRDKYEDLMFKVAHHRGVGIPFKNLDEIKEIGFKVDNNTYPVKTDTNGDLILDSNYVEMVEDSGHDVSLDVLYSEFDDVTADIKNADKFLRNAEEAIPEERTDLNLKEALVFTFKTNLKIIPRGYETGTGLEIFDTVSFTASGGETQYPITLGSIPKEQILVLVNEDEWVMDGDYTNGQHHYSVEPDKIVFNKQLKNGDKVIITDRYSAFDQYRGTQMFIHKNIQSGGYDGDMVMPDFMNDSEDRREFIIYTQDGRVHAFECDEADAIAVNGSVSYAQESLELSANVSDSMKLANQEQGKIAVIYGEEIDGSGKLVSSRCEFIHYTSADGMTIEGIKRGLFGKNPKEFDSNKYNIKVYPLTIDDNLPSFTITEPYLGIRGKASYPKYGHIMSGKD